MIKLVIIKNPFEPWNGRELHTVEVGKTADEVIRQYMPACANVDILVNSKPIEPDVVIPDDSFVVIYPKVMGGDSGKNILGTIAMIALSVYAGGIAGGLWAKGGSFFAKGALGAVMASAAVMFVGGTLINRLFGQKVDTGNFGDLKNDATYSWDGIQTMEGQNNSIALTYGTVQSGGQTIGKFVDVLDNKEYLNWLVAAGEGPLTISNIQLNDNAASYYKDLTVETREGTNTQTVIPNFNDTYSTKQLGYQLLAEERVDTVPGNASEGIITKVEFSNGLYYANDSGGLDDAWVEILGEYRKAGTENWIPFVYGVDISSGAVGISVINGRMPSVGQYSVVVVDQHDPEELLSKTITITYPDGSQMSGTIRISEEQAEVGDFVVSASATTGTFSVVHKGARITAHQSSALRKEFRIDPLESAAYEVRMQVTARSHDVDSSRAAVRCWWSSLTSIVHDDFSYPNIALIGIKALATDQLSGTPTLKFLKTRPYVLVWNPTTEAYEQQASDNPAWACYDVLHQCSYLQDANTGAWEYDVRGIPAKYMLYDQFKAWADFCQEKNYKVNIELNTVGEMLATINNNIAAVGHGKVIRFGTRYGCIYDHVQQPVQMFGMGNIIAGSFQEEFMQTSDRANCVELTYMDAANDYNRETITIYSDTYDTDAEEKTAQATFDGITSYEQAYREGMYQLYSNLYLRRTISFEANIDAIACTVGDVILVAHDVPRWAKSGRIHRVDGDTLLLPVELDSTEGDYRIQYRTLNDNIYTSAVTILKNEDGWCKVQLASINEADPPQEQDIFDLAQATVGAKPFVVKSISRAQDFTRTIECIEYDERIYNEEYDIPEPQYSSEGAMIKNVSGLSAMKYQYMAADGTIHYRLDISWERESLGTYQIFTSNDNVNWDMLVSIDGTQYTGDVPEDTAYVKVVTVNSIMRSPGVSMTITNMISMIAGLEIADLTATISGTSVKLTWREITNTNLQYYRILVDDSSEYRVLNATFELSGLRAGRHVIDVTAVNKAGISGFAATTTITIP